MIGANAAAWMIGFLSPIPAGLGIREVALGVMFQPLAPVTQIIFVSLVQRTLELLLEIGLWLVAVALSKADFPQYS